ncbi:MAG: DeoR/GlpR family DNA-binding transcription regulator [Chloroflexota bacterium]|nr:DeoR/GlpR family DNA-binding transcription regulator [Chloroflexota bacterium]
MKEDESTHKLTKGRQRRMAVSRDLYLEERRQHILEQVQQDGRVSVTQLSELLGVSEVTIRNDLRALEGRGLLVRTHGGAVAANASVIDIALSRRRQRQIREKVDIGIAGANLIADGDAIFLDSSSTALAIAQQLKQRNRITVVSNSLAVAQDLLTVPGITVVMPGGRLHPDTVSLIGTDGLAFLKQFNIQMGFFGAHGIACQEGLTDISVDEANAKRSIVELCREVIAVVDATKWGQVGLASFAQLDEIDLVISNLDAPADLVAQVRAAGVKVVLI